MIAIKDIKMPISCGRCPFVELTGWEIIYAHCRLSGVSLDNIKWTREKHPKCPLIEVKDDDSNQRDENAT